MIDGKIFLDQPINSNIKTYENIRKIATGQADNYTTGHLLDFCYFKDHYKMIAIDLSKQQTLDADPRAIHQINFMSNLDRAGNYLSVDIKLSKAQLSKMIQSGGFLGRLLSPLLKTGLPLIKNVIKPLAKSVSIPLGLTAAASAVDAGIHKKNLGVWE